MFFNLIKRVLFRNKIASAVILAIFLIALLGAFERLELNLYDAWFKFRGEIQPGNDIVIVGIDEESIQKIGPPPWSRSVHAQILDRLKDAKVTGFDLLFDIPGDTATDTSFAEAVKRNGRVVLASSFRYESENGQWFQKLLNPLRTLASSCNGVGFINVPEDVDGVVRSNTTIDTNTFKKPYPSLGLAVALVAEGLNPNALQLARPDLLIAGSHQLPLTGSNRLLLNFAGGSNTFKTYSYADVLEGKYPPDEFSGKIILIGNTSPIFKDDFRTPFSASNLVLSGKPPTPGVEIHANTVNTVLSNSPYRRAVPSINLAVLILATIATTWAVRRRSPFVGLGLVLLLTVVFISVVHLIWLHSRLWLNLAAPVILIFFLYTSTTLQSFIATELERRRTRAIFGRYVSPTVMKELLDNPDLAALGGQRREVTILFADIRGFTAYSENKPPEEVVARLNTYLDKMTSLIFEYGGTLDKFLGDGLMAVFGVPLQLDDHADRAVICALSIQKATEDLNASWLDEGERPLRIGVGINSGSVLAGNVGSRERMDYTVMGEEVNLASRLEGLTKEYGCNIIISGQTRERMTRFEDGAVVKDLGSVQVRGFSRMVQVFGITAEDEDVC